MPCKPVCPRFVPRVENWISEAVISCQIFRRRPQRARREGFPNSHLRPLLEGIWSQIDDRHGQMLWSIKVLNLGKCDGQIATTGVVMWGWCGGECQSKVWVQKWRSELEIKSRRFRFIALRHGYRLLLARPSPKATDQKLAVSLSPRFLFLIISIIFISIIFISIIFISIIFITIRRIDHPL